MGGSGRERGAEATPQAVARSTSCGSSSVSLVTRKLSGSTTSSHPWRRRRFAIPLDARPVNATAMSTRVSNAAAFTPSSGSASNHSRSPSPSASGSSSRCFSGFAASSIADASGRGTGHAVRVGGAAHHEQVGTVEPRAPTSCTDSDLDHHPSTSITAQARADRIRDRVGVAVHRLVHDDRSHGAPPVVVSLCTRCGPQGNRGAGQPLEPSLLDSLRGSP